MRYPLNVTPLNDTETHLALGVADQAMQGAGSGFLVMHTAGQAAALALAAYGSDAGHKAGSGEAAMALASSGLGYARIHGAGWADAALLADGDGSMLPFMGGLARLVMLADGDGRMAQAGAGTADLDLWTDDRSANPLALAGSGVAELAVTGIAGMPFPIMPPARFTTTHASRLVSVANDNRTIRGGQDG